MRGKRGGVLALAAAAAATLGVCAHPAAASDKLWNNPLGGSFHLDANWTGGAPGPLDNALFDLGSLLPYVVNISSDVSNNQLRVGNDQLQLAFVPAVTYSLTSASASVPAVVVGDLPGDNAQLTLLNATIVAAGEVVVGADGNGTLTIPTTSRLSAAEASIGFAGTGHLLVQSGGRFSSSSGSIGSNPGATGTAIIDGGGSNWTNTGNLYVGDFAHGDLTVSNNALVQSGGIFSGYAGSGTISVDSGGALISNSSIRVGDTPTGVGLLNITGGGTAQSAVGSIGFAGGNGAVLVNGSNSRWTVSGALEAGWSGTATLNIQSQGRVLAGVMDIGVDALGNGTVRVSGGGSSLGVGGLLTVGKDGKGSLIVDGGGTVSSIGGVIGSSSAGPNVVSVDGIGSTWNMGNNLLVVGDDGSGTLELSGEAVVSNGLATIGRGAGGNGAVVLDGPPATRWITSGVNIGLDGSGLLQVSGGVVNGTSAAIGGLANGPAGTGVAVVTGINSYWLLTGQLIIGGGGFGNLSIESGGKVTAGAAIVGDGAGSSGTVNLKGGGLSWTINGGLLIGNNGGGDVTVESGAAGSSGALDIGINGAGNLSIVGAGSLWTSSGPVRVAVGHFGTLLLDAGGALVSPSATVGSASGAIGQVNIRNGSSWNNSGTLNVGRGGSDGFVSIDSGGQLTSGPTNIGGDGSALGGNGAVLVKGAGSHWTAGAVVLGLGGSGDIEASAGGVIDAAALIISNGPSSSLGFAKVADGGSRLNVTSTIEVGHDLNGSLDVSNGGVVSSGSAIIGTAVSATGTATIAGGGSQWNTSGNLIVAANGAGALSVSGGGIVRAAIASIGSNPSGTGTVTINDAGSSFALSDSLYIGGNSGGSAGNGTVSVGNGASVVATNQIKVWASGTLDLNNGNVASGLVDLQGGLISGSGAIASPVSSTNGRVSTNAAIALSGPLSIVSGTNLTKQGTGTLSISGTQAHGAGAMLNVAGGTVLLNSDAGVAATAASAASANLMVRVSGSNVTLGADQELMGLDVQFANPGSQSFDVATSSAAGAFRSVRVYPADLTGTKTALYAAIRNANAGGAADPSDGIFDSGLAAHANSKLGIARLSDPHGDPYILIRPTRIGDLNLDGAVTISDFIDLASNFNGVNKTWQEGDLNYDGSVTISDFIDLASNFNGNYAGSLSALGSDDARTIASFASSIGVDPSVIGSAVPEPSCLLMAGVGASLLATRRRRR